MLVTGTQLMDTFDIYYLFFFFLLFFIFYIIQANLLQFKYIIEIHYFQQFHFNEKI